MMLPTKNRVILLEESPKSIRVRYKDREWLFPRDDCVLLPIENTTAELLARYIGERLREDLQHDVSIRAGCAASRGRRKLRAIGDMGMACGVGVRGQGL